MGANTKQIVWISVFVVIVGGGLAYLMLAKPPNGFNNPEIFPSFRKIENYALTYVGREEVNREEYERCKLVVDRMENDYKLLDKDPNYFPPAEEYYNFLISLGFKLPPIRLDTPSTKEKQDQCMKEQDELLDQQAEIYDQLLQQMDEKIEEIFKDVE